MVVTQVSAGYPVIVEGRARVLVVEPDRALAGSLAEFLATAGYEVAVAGSGREAFAALESGDTSVVLLGCGFSASRKRTRP